MNHLAIIIIVAICCVYVYCDEQQLHCFTNHKDLEKDDNPLPHECNDTFTDTSDKWLKSRNFGVNITSSTYKNDNYDCFYVIIKKLKIKYLGCIKKNFIACKINEEIPNLDPDDFSCMQCSENLCNLIRKASHQNQLQPNGLQLIVALWIFIEIF